MQLKKDKTENLTSNTEGMTNTQILRMYDQGFFDKKEEKEGEIKPQSKYSDDYSRSGTNTNYADSVVSEYDEKTERNSFRMTEEQVKESLAPTKKQIRDRNDSLMIVTGYILYAVYGIVIFMFAKACMQDNVDIIFNLKRWLILLVVIEVYSIFDAILVYGGYEKKLVLFPLAIFLPVIYPFYRRKLVTGGISGIIITILVIFAAVMILINVRWANLDYGNVIHWDDGTVRHYMAELMDQTDSNDVRFGTKINRHMDLEGADVETKGGKTEIFVTGKTDIHVGEDSSAGKIPVTMTFTKEGSGDYSLTAVDYDGVKLTKSQLNQFNEKLLDNE